MNNDKASSLYTSVHAYDNPVLLHTASHDRDVKTTDRQRDESPTDMNISSMLTLDLSQGITDISIADSSADGIPRRSIEDSPVDGIPRRSIEDSPLDLPSREQLLPTSNEMQILPNVLLDT